MASTSNKKMSQKNSQRTHSLCHQIKQKLPNKIEHRKFTVEVSNISQLSPQQGVYRIQQLTVKDTHTQRPWLLNHHATIKGHLLTYLG